MGGRHVTEDYILCSASVMTPILETALTENNRHEKTFGSESFQFFFFLQNFSLFPQPKHRSNYNMGKL